MPAYNPPQISCPHCQFEEGHSLECKSYKPSPPPMPKSILERFDEITRKFTKKAGSWHKNDCQFGHNDEWECTCKLADNRDQIHNFLTLAISEAFTAGQQAEKDRLRVEIEKMKGRKYNKIFTFEEAIDSILKLLV